MKNLLTFAVVIVAGLLAIGCSGGGDEAASQPAVEMKSVPTTGAPGGPAGGGPVAQPTESLTPTQAGG